MRKVDLRQQAVTLNRFNKYRHDCQFVQRECGACLYQHGK